MGRARFVTTAVGWILFPILVGCETPAGPTDGGVPPSHSTTGAKASPRDATVGRDAAARGRPSLAVTPPFPEAPPPTEAPARLIATRNGPCAIWPDGTARCWGYHGRPTTRAFLVPGTPVVDLARDEEDECVVLGDGSVRAIGPSKQHDLCRPSITAGLREVTQISFSGDRACVLFQDATVACWASPVHGTDAWPKRPERVQELGGVVQIELASDRACALHREGTVWCWGHGDDGRLGDGTGEDRDRPTKVLGLGDAKQISLGDLHACALRRERTVVCWGANSMGQLGTGDRGYQGHDAQLEEANPPWRHYPVPVKGLRGVEQIAVGHRTTTARLADGSVWYWGWDRFDQNGPVPSPRRTQLGTLARQSDLARATICTLDAAGNTLCVGRLFGIESAVAERARRAHKPFELAW